MDRKYNVESREYNIERALAVAREIAPYLNNPPKHIRERIRRVERWYEAGLPKAHSPEVLGAACNF